MGVEVLVVLWSLFGWACIVNHDLYQERKSFFTDDDGDGFSEGDGDCDDEDPLVAPDKFDECDQIDNDCDGVVDEDAVLLPWYTDADGDGFGAGEPIESCEQPNELSAYGTDCDDSDAGINPGAQESWYDGDDGDCSGNESDYDADGDGEDSDQYGGTDCNDEDPYIGTNRSEGWLDTPCAPFHEIATSPS